MAEVLERVTKIIVDRLGVDESQVKLEASFKTQRNLVVVFLPSSIIQKEAPFENGAFE
jgi:hypothetical protein